jgi:hypothetical protein
MPPGDRVQAEPDSRLVGVRRSLRRRARRAARAAASLQLAQRDAYARHGPSLC